MAKNNVTLQRLDDQIKWYSNKSGQNQFWFKFFKIIELIIAVLIPFLSSFEIPRIIYGLMGVLIAILEGIQQLFQFNHNWITYRSTAENLKHEKYLWLAKAGPYLNIKNAKEVLADRIESLISQEHSKWITTYKQSDKNSK